MKRLPLNKGLLEDRLLFIERSVQSLERFKSATSVEFQANPDNFRIAYYSASDFQERMATARADIPRIT